MIPRGQATITLPVDQVVQVRVMRYLIARFGLGNDIRNQV